MHEGHSQRTSFSYASSPPIVLPEQRRTTQAYDSTGNVLARPRDVSSSFTNGNAGTVFRLPETGCFTSTYDQSPPRAGVAAGCWTQIYDASGPRRVVEANAVSPVSMTFDNANREVSPLCVDLGNGTASAADVGRAFVVSAGKVDSRATRRGQYRRDNEDLLAKLDGVLARISSPGGSLLAVLTDDDVACKMWNAGFRSVGIAFKSKDPLAENAAQSGCLKLLQFLISTGSPEWFAKNRHKLLPTLARVIRNVCMAAAREARGEVSGLILMCDYAPDGPKEVFWAANGTNQDLELDLAEQLKAMPETLRTAFQEHCDGDSFADIAARHGCSPSTIQRRYAEAVEWLQRKMQAYDRDS